MSGYRLLPVTRFCETSTLCQPSASPDTRLDSPATDIFTDFKFHAPRVIESGVSIDEAEQMMRKAHVKLKIVVDGDDRILGMLSYGDLSGERFQQLVGQGFTQGDINVNQVMTPRLEIRSLSYRELTQAKVGDVIETLRHEHCQHFLVTDNESGLVRGVISASDIARRLHIAIDISSTPSFAQICHEAYAQAHR